MKLLLLNLGLLCLLLACTIEAKPIEYGADKCEFCRMTIVDKQHGAEVVTAKGKVYKFDAIECQVLYLQEQSDQQYAHTLVNDYYSTSGDLIPADSCTFLISVNIPSPMGANISAFRNPAIASLFHKENGGELFDWPSLRAKLKR